MTALELGLAAGVLILLAGHLLYEILVIQPRTDLRGRYAAYIEAEHLHRWLWPVLSGTAGPYSIIFAGNSHFMDGIDPLQITAVSRQRAFNLASYNVSSLDMAELVLNHHLRPAVVVIEVCPSYCLYQGPAAIHGLVAPPVNRRRYRVEVVLSDYLEWLLPYVFTPRRFRPVLRRCLREWAECRRTRLISLKRYTPFRPLVSFQWALDKRTNHRVVRQVQRKTRWELAAEQANIQRVKAGMAQACPIGTPAYDEMLQAARRIMGELQHRGIQVLLCRMPLQDEISRHEDEHCAAYFKDMAVIARDLQIELLDLSSANHRALIGALDYYNDGQHLFQRSAERLSRYLAQFLPHPHAPYSS